MRKIVTLIFMSACLFCFPQENKKKNSPFSIRGNVGINRPISSHMFRTAFSGIFEANLSVNVRVFGNFFVGAGYQNSFFKNSKFIAQQVFTSQGTFAIPYNTSLDGHGIFLKIGYDHFISPNVYTSYSINSGIMLMHYSEVNLDTNIANKPYGPLKFSAPFVQPEFSVNFIAEKHLSFSVMLSYTTLFSDFDPKSPRLNHIREISSKGNSYFMSWFNIGFGFHVLIGK